MVPLRDQPLFLAMQIPIAVLVAGGGALVGLFVAALLLVRSEGDHRANLVLAALMVLLSLSILYPLVFPALPSLSRTHAVLILEPFQFLIAPLMGLFFRVLLVPKYLFRPVQLLHGLPFVLFGLMSLVPIPSSGPAPGHLTASRMTEVLWALLVIQAFIYLLPALRLLFTYRHSLRDQESNVAGLDLGWLQWFAHLFLALSTSYAVLLIIMLHGPRAFPGPGVPFDCAQRPGVRNRPARAASEANTGCGGARGASAGPGPGESRGAFRGGGADQGAACAGNGSG